MLISRALVKIFSEQSPSFICWTLDFGGTSRIISELRALNRALNTIFFGALEKALNGHFRSIIRWTLVTSEWFCFSAVIPSSDHL